LFVKSGVKRITKRKKEMDAKKRVLVTFKNKLFDITDFMHKHPGGVGTLKGLENKDMEARFYSGPPHSDAAMYLLQEYQVRTDDNETDEKMAEKTTKVINNEDIIDTTKSAVDESMEVSNISLQ
jgi:4-hydroxysphinganine ceramide fatty acyl 2-hydroxylase